MGPRRRDGEERPVDQAVEHVGAHEGGQVEEQPGDVLRGEGRGEHGEVAEHPLLALVEQVVRPGDGHLDVVVARAVGLARPALRLVQHALLRGDEPVDLVRRVRADAGRGQLDRQGQPVEAAHERSHGGLVLREGEVGPHGRGARHEEGHGGVLVERGQVEQVLVVECEAPTARGQDGRAGAAGPEGLGHLRRVVEHMVATVEDHEGSAVGQRPDHAVERAGAVDGGRAEQVGEPAGDATRPGRAGVERAQRAEPGATGPAGVVVPRQLDGEAGLPRAGRAGDGDEAVAVDELGQAPALDRSTQEPPGRRGDAAPGVVLGAQRPEAGRQVGGRDLVDALGLDEVAQPVLAEVEQGDVGRQRPVQEAGQGGGDDDLAPVGHRWRRAVRLMVGPNQSPSRGSASPQCSPIRTRRGPEPQVPAASARCASTAATTPSTGRSNTAATPSPSDLKTCPPWALTTLPSRWSWWARSSRMSAGAASHSRVLPSTSVNRNVGPAGPPDPTGASLPRGRGTWRFPRRNGHGCVWGSSREAGWCRLRSRGGERSRRRA